MPFSRLCTLLSSDILLTEMYILGCGAQNFIGDNI